MCLAAVCVSAKVNDITITGMPKLQTFGTGRSAFQHDLDNTGIETSIFTHVLSQDAEVGVMNHFWTTGKSFTKFQKTHHCFYYSTYDENDRQCR